MFPSGCSSHCWDKVLGSVLKEVACRLARTAGVPGYTPWLVDPGPVAEEEGI